MKGIIFTYGLTVVGAVAGLFSPFYGLLVYVCFAIIRPDYMWQWTLGYGGNHSRTVGVALLIGWAVNGFGQWRFGRGAAVIFCLLAYWGWSMISAVQALEPARALDLVEFFAKVFLPFLVGITTIRTVKQLKQLAWVIVLSQGYVAFELNLLYYGGYNQLFFDGFGGMDNNCVAIAMVTGIGCAFFMGVGAERWWQSGIALVSAALMAHTIMFSFSRGGLLALALTGVMAFILIPKRPSHYLLFLLAIALAIRMAGPQVRERFATSFQESETGKREASAESRLHLWTHALHATLERPIFGVGPDNWGLVAPEYGWKRGKEAHSLWMQNAAEVGIPGALLLAAFFVVCMVRLWPIARGKTPPVDPWFPDASRMVIASLFGFVIAAQFVTIKYLEVPYYIALIGVGVLKLSQPEVEANASWQPPAIPRLLGRARVPAAS